MTAVPDASSSPAVITVLQPDPTVPLDRFTQWLPSTHRTVLLTEEPVPPLADCGEGIVVLGGRGNAIDDATSPFLPALRELLRAAVDAQVPVLGICLGHQILAHTFGGELTLASAEQDQEGAFAVQLTAAGREDPVLGGLDDEFWTAQSHHDAVTRLPEQAQLLATSAQCPIQAFHLGSAVGVQFHPEASPELMARWRENYGENASALLAQMRSRDEQIAAAGRHIAEAFGQVVRERTDR